MIKIRFYCWWKHGVDNLAVFKMTMNWDVTALYFYFGVMGFELAIKVYKYKIAQKFRRAKDEEDYLLFT